MKLLSANAGYLLDYDGSLSDYVLKPHRAMVGSERAEERAMDRLVDVIVDEQPDVVFLIEVDKGSFRTVTDGQVEKVADVLQDHGLDYHAHAYAKYGDSGLLSTLPMFGDLANGLLIKEGHEAEAHYIKTGPKRLVTEVLVDHEFSLFMVHLAMSKRTRRKQLEEIAELVANHDRVVIAGDFNAYGGLDELDILTDRGLVLHNPGETVPPRPLDSIVTQTRTLDLFLTSPDLTVTRCDVIDVQVSDHRPVVLEIEDAD